MEPPRGLPRVSGVVTLSAGMRDEVAAMYARSCPGLVGLLSAIGGSRSDAEEIAQEAYVRLLLRWSKVRTYDDPDAWVRTVAVRILISRHRRAKVASMGLGRLAGQPTQDFPELTVDAVAISAALRALPIGQRAVVILHHVVDLSVDQVAHELHLPVGTVKSRLSRARAALAPLLRETEETNHV